MVYNAMKLGRVLCFRGFCKTVLLSKFCIFVISKSSRITYTLRF